MQLFIWQYLEKVSSNYHKGGGLVIVAPSLDAAKELVSIDENIVINKPCDAIYTVEDSATPMYMVFPDAGCC